MTVAEASAIMRGRLSGAAGEARDAREVRFGGVAIDSRQAGPGDLFVAIDNAGGRDGHDFIADAARQGAVAALVSTAGTGDLPQIEVADTTAALGQLGADWRRRFDLPLVAVTGSNGKTTVTALIAAIFNCAGGDNCLAPRASFNNQWGVPLTLLRLRASHTHAVIEMGMNHPGEIAHLAGLARPQVALINNVAPAHLAGVADLQGVAAAKAEIFRGLGADGIAVLNADDAFHDFWREELRRLGVSRIVRFSTAADSDAAPAQQTAGVTGEVTAAPLADGRIELEIAGQTIVADWALPGAHNIANAAAAAAAAHAAGARPADIAAGLSAFPGALPGRLFAFTGESGATVIDDSYNANPASMRVALRHLATAAGVRIAVLGRMAELGGESAAMHRAAGECARELGIDRLLCLDESHSDDIAALLAGFGGGERFAGLERLLARLRPLLDARATVLIKGSRSTDMGRVVERLKPRAEAAVESTVATAATVATVATAAPPANESPPGGPPC